MGRDGARPSRGKQWSETAIGSLIGTWRAPVPRRRESGRDNVLISRLQGTAALQVNDVFQGGMASVPSQFSPCYNYKG